MDTGTASGDTFDSWLNSLHGACGARFQAERGLGGSLFIGQARPRCLAGLEQVQIRTNAARIARRLPSGAQDGDRYCFLVLQGSGRSLIHQFDRTLALEPGDLALVDSAADFEIEPQGLIEHLSLHLPRREVLAHLTGEQPTFGKVARHTLSGRTLLSFYRELLAAEGAVPVRADEQGALQEVILALLGPALTAEPAASALAQQPSALQRRGAEAFILERLHEASLSPAQVADGIGVSLRQLYRLFAEDAMGISEWIRHRRLARCAADLRDGSQDHLPITEIAFRWGFSDAAHFSRAFKQQFGVAPRDYRGARVLVA
ncbi:transcriptional regulator FeaR [Pseudomonas oryzihabitans]|uniref:transcriptional regulator FeaR n=1 Tax=Pseudomonas oryzihabitans TaxID=47885 RepID=UPI0028D2D3AA|nr:transcriptional regulator FeaR [uncultured Pseudomonas sp.]